jgi:hypothetical protein
MKVAVNKFDFVAFLSIDLFQTKTWRINLVSTRKETSEKELFCLLVKE